MLEEAIVWALGPHVSVVILILAAMLTLVYGVARIIVWAVARSEQQSHR